MKRILIVPLLLLSIASIAQEELSDGYLNANDFKNVAPTPYPEIKPMDILSVKRVWRDIDTAEEENKIFVSPHAMLINILVTAIQQGIITPYSAASSAKNPFGDAFTEPISPQKALNILTGDSVLVPILDTQGNIVNSKWLAREFDPEKVTKFRIKEDWIFDRGRGIYEPRIIGIAPLIKVSAMGQLLSEQPAFWVNFNQTRKVLAQHQVIVKSTTSYSYDDIFLLRKFSSTIIKEHNHQNLKIADYATSKEEAERESKRIEDSLSDYRNQVWSGNSGKSIN